MNCPNCGSNEARKTTIFFTKEGKRIENCNDCPDRYHPAPMFNSNGIRVQGAYGGKGFRTAAHNDDISRRRARPDGSIYRDRGRVTIGVTRR